MQKIRLNKLMELEKLFISFPLPLPFPLSLRINPSASLTQSKINLSGPVSPFLYAHPSRKIPRILRTRSPFPLPHSRRLPITSAAGGFDMAKKSNPRPRKLSVYLYIPNLVGYVRVLMNCYAFAVCYSDKRLFSVLYFLSFVCDGIDGWCARKFNQVSTFGAVLDMVTDRISTACLLVILSQVYSPGLIFLSLLALDISSHWLQMYSTFLLGKGSHKDVQDSSNWLFRLYYGNRKFMAYCCVACEVLYIILFLVADKKTENLTDVLMSLAKQNSPLTFLTAVSLFGWAIKQIVNVIQMKTAADICVLYDIRKKQASS